jgi:hypothetical protein
MLNLMSASKAEIAVADAAYRRGIVLAQARLREHLLAAGGPEANGSVESLAAIGSWFLQHIQDADDGSVVESIPAWWDPSFPVAGSGVEGDGPFTGQQLRLIDEVHAYVAEVLMNEIPGAQWEIYKGSKKDLRNGSTVLKLKGHLQAYSLSLVYGAALNTVLYSRPVSGNLFFDEVSKSIAKAA